MGILGNRFTEIGRGYEQVTETYQRPYVIGVDTNERDKPFIVAMGAHHSDSGATLLSITELLSEKWKEHVAKSNCTDFIGELKKAVENGEQFPQKIILEKVNKIRENN